MKETGPWSVALTVKSFTVRRATVRWHAILERFFEILADGVHRFEGTINHFTGDTIMALFGAPIAHENHAHRACYAAIHLRDQLRGQGDELRVSKGIDFGVADPAQEPSQLDEGQTERRVFDLLLHLTRARSEREPAVLLFEDLHCFDDLSESFFRQLADAVAGTRTLLIGN